MLIFFNYLVNLYSNRESNHQKYNIPYDNIINIIGESHSLSPTNIVFQWGEQLVRGVPGFIIGIKMHHLASRNPHLNKVYFSNHINALCDQSERPIIITIGEIDCRPDEGIWPTASKWQKDVEEVVKITVDGYVNYLDKCLKGRKLSSVTIQGVPAPGYSLTGRDDPGDIPGFLAMIRSVNERLKSKSLAIGFNFLDVYSATVAKDGMSNGRWHLDGRHLDPRFYCEALNWLIKS